MKHYLSPKFAHLSISTRLFFAVIATMALSINGATAEGNGPSALKDGKIGYVLYYKHWALHQTPEGKTECPQGFNDGPREQFKILFPDDGQERTLMETQIARESEVWHPSLSKEPYEFIEVVGKISRGFYIDGQSTTEDFVSPTGEEGIDNQLYRTLGCVANFRGPDGTAYHFENSFMQTYNYNRFLIELSGVDSLIDDDEIIVTTYRGLDYLMTDASGKDFIPGGTQRIDMRWGKQFIQEFKGKIVDGVLTTEAADLDMPWSSTFATSGVHSLRGVRFHMEITPDGAEGLMAGYADIQDWYYHATTTWSTHHQSYGQESSPSIYRAMHRLADGYPDPDTGKNTAISMAIDVKFKQAYLINPSQGNPEQTLDRVAYAE